MQRLDSGDHVTRLHTLAEFFSTMTNRGVLVPDQTGALVRVVFDANDCASWLRKFAAKVQFEELEKDGVLDALDKAQSRNVLGPKVYDYFHLLVSARANASEVPTRNTKEFALLNHAINGQAKVEWP